MCLHCAISKISEHITFTDQTNETRYRKKTKGEHEDNTLCTRQKQEYLGALVGYQGKSHQQYKIFLTSNLIQNPENNPHKTALTKK